MSSPLRLECIPSLVSDALNEAPQNDVEQHSQRVFEGVSATIFRGYREIVDQLPLLIQFAEQCSQRPVADQIDYYISRPFQREKTPCLVLLRSGPGDGEGEIDGALLLYEFNIRGRGTGIFATYDKSGTRTV